jgi:hypothetical protein
MLTCDNDSSNRTHGGSYYNNEHWWKWYLSVLLWLIIVELLSTINTHNFFNSNMYIYYSNFKVEVININITLIKCVCVCVCTDGGK